VASSDDPGTKEKHHAGNGDTLAPEVALVGYRPTWSQAEHERERVVDSALLLRAQPTGELA
jgi:hypothetical protein